MQTKASFDLPQRDLKQLLAKVLFAVPVRDPRKVLLGSLFEIRKDTVAAIATDGKILARTKMPFQTDMTEKPADMNVIIPHKIMDELIRTLGDDGTVNVSFDDRQIAFRLNRIEYVSNQIDGKYPNYEAVVPKEFSRELRFQKPPMLSAIRRAAILSDIKNSAITVHFQGDKVSIEAESYDKGRIHEEIPAVVEGEDFKIVFNYKFMQDVLKNIDKEEVILQVNQPTTPAVFRGAEEDSYFYLVMPIKLKELLDHDEDRAPAGVGSSEESGNSYEE
jgi:DNA polymerase-3 subunit beta